MASEEWLRGRHFAMGEMKKRELKLKAVQQVARTQAKLNRLLLRLYYLRELLAEGPELPERQRRSLINKMDFAIRAFSETIERLPESTVKDMLHLAAHDFEQDKLYKEFFERLGLIQLQDEVQIEGDNVYRMSPRSGRKG